MFLRSDLDGEPRQDVIVIAPGSPLQAGSTGRHRCSFGNQRSGQMTSKYIVVIFPNEAKAYEGMRALKDLQGDGSLLVYGTAVVAKDANGKFAVKQAADAGPLGLGVGSLLGGLIGMFGGPVGAAVGMGYGAMVGGLSDLYYSGAGVDFVNKVAEELTPGKTALIAEVAEEWVTPLDTRMEAIGGVVMREWRSDFEDEQIEKECAARKAELAQLKAEYTRAAEERKTKLKAQMGEAQAKLNATAERTQGRIRQLEQEAQAKIDQLQGQTAKAKGDAKLKIERQIAEIQADYNRRSGKLKQAWELTKQALAA